MEYLHLLVFRVHQRGFDCLKFVGALVLHFHSRDPILHVLLVRCSLGSLDLVLAVCLRKHFPV